MRATAQAITDVQNAHTARQLRLINLSMDSQLNGAPSISPEQVRVWASDWAISSVTAGDAKGMCQLRDLTRLARQIHDPELEAVMRRCRRWVSRQEGDLELVETLRSWRFDGPELGSRWRRKPARTATVAPAKGPARARAEAAPKRQDPCQFA